MEVYNPTAIGVSTGFGVPTGGTSGQFLVKNSSSNFDTSWVANPVSKMALFHSSSNTYGAAADVTWGITRWNGFTTDEVQTADNKTFTLKAGVYLIEWAASYATEEYVYNDLYLNGSLYLSSLSAARAAAGGGTNWSGPGWKTTVIDARVSNQAIKFNAGMYANAPLKITKIV